MNILICGADGFVGRHLTAQLRNAGHRVLRGVRRPREIDDIAIDYTRDTTEAVWLPRLEDVDVAINAIGILIESPQQPFGRIHAEAPSALFSACASRGNIRAIQISALGVEQGATPYFRTKLAADRHLAETVQDWAIVRPGLIYGDDGGSSRVFRLLATLPVIGLPGKGDQLLQPIHIDDLCLCIQRLVETSSTLRQVYELGGSVTLSYRDLIERYRSDMGLGKTLFVPIPMAVMHLTAKLAEYLPQRVLSKDTLSMLAGGNTTDSDSAQRLLGHAPLPPERFITSVVAPTLRHEAVQQWATPLMLLTLAIMWLCGGIFSLLNKAESYALLSRVGLHGDTAYIMLHTASVLDIALGLLTLLRPSRCLWIVQFMVVLAYTAIISALLPAYLLHPFGPVIKNLPILVILLALYSSASRRC